MGQSEPMRIPASRDGLPRRGDGKTRPPGLAPRVPPAPMALVRGRRPLKRWRYVGVFGPEAMLCAGIVRVAGVPQCFWAVWDRAAGELRERTRMRLGTVALPEGAVRVRDAAGGVAIDLALQAAGEPVEVTSPHSASYIWTRKQPATAGGTVVLDEREIAVHAPALVDDSAGYRAREAAWGWCAGAGRRRERGGPDLARGAVDPHTATCASPPRPSARATIACCSACSRASTASRSARSRTPCPAASRSRPATASWSATSRAGEPAGRYARNDPRTPSAGPATAPDSSSARISSAG
jgi:hypothetical protein